jgi:hypothetical protein
MKAQKTYFFVWAYDIMQSFLFREKENTSKNSWPNFDFIDLLTKYIRHSTSLQLQSLHV